MQIRAAVVKREGRFRVYVRGMGVVSRETEEEATKIAEAINHPDPKDCSESAVVASNIVDYFSTRC